MNDPSPLTRALDEAMSAVADAIEVYYRSTASRGNSSVEVREALSRAMKWVSEASRLEDERRAAERAVARTALVMDGVPLVEDAQVWAAAAPLPGPAPAA